MGDPPLLPFSLNSFLYPYEKAGIFLLKIPVKSQRNPLKLSFFLIFLPFLAE